ncbi:LytR/AlgR family response regulator transcription factor [Mucilaginibacter rubeus]|uniref:Response regulator transcription factor n=1 Tax=Mucilaginibacter rubeus TaxID=2027860 RepID=A0A5C1I0E4_9SPHI|nr:LytTR family DNA-binding domain-containing protein [Mucilaginibacter rubeus]QEM10688.1 response regulator transcription factor [Mucilaginibacter rubeus]
MKKIRCLLVDDEPLAITLLQNHITRFDFLEVTATCPNALKAFETLKSKDVDLMFLDVRMPVIDGIEFLKMLRNPPRVIITTAYRDYAIDGYDLDIVDYLLKPITFERFFKAIERYLRYASQPAQPLVSSDAAPENIVLKSGYRNVKVNVADILYMESVKDYVKVYTLDATIVTKYKISDMESDLASKNFLRIHRSFIVNQQHITAFSASDVELGKKELPIGESYKEHVIRILKK